MKKTLIFIISILFTNIYSQTIEFGMPNNDPHFEIEFSDEFNYLDFNKWDAIVAPDGDYYLRPYSTARPDNIDVSGGKLRLTLKSELYAGHRYTNGRLITKNLYGGKGTFIETYSKINNSLETICAFWTWYGNGAKGASYDYREIDILEWFPKGNVSSANYHFSDISKAEVIHDETVNYQISNAYNQFHSYSVFISNRNITHFLDNVSVKFSERKSNNLLIQKAKIFNTIHKEFRSPQDDLDVWIPSTTYEVDFVRIWKMKKNCTSIINNIPNFNNYTYTLKKQINLGATTIFPTNQNISLRAVDAIIFFDGFTIPSSNFNYVFNTNECD
jgi:hypothetical protein